MISTRTLPDPFLISERELARLILDQLDTAIVICDSDGTIVLANPSAQSLYKGDPMGLAFDVAFPMTWLQKEGDVDSAALAKPFSLSSVVQGESQRGLCLFQKDENPRRALMVNAAPYSDADHEFLCCLVTMMDVTASETAQRRLNAVVEGTTDAIYVKDVDSRYLMMNRAGSAVIGRTVEEIVGKTPFEVFDPQTAAQLRADDERVMKLGMPETVENKIPTPTGLRIFHSVKAPYRNRAGEVVGTIGVSRDVTELRQAQIDLARQAALLDLSPDAILVRTLDGTILFWSRGAAQLYGWEPDQVLGKNKFEILKPHYDISLQELSQQLYQEGKWQGEVKHHRRDGSILRIATRKVVQFDENRNPVAVLEVNEDMTERRRIQEAQTFLADATAVFSASLDFDSTLARIANLTVPLLADMCAVHVLMDDGTIRRLAFAHHDPQVIERVTARPQQYSFDPNAQHLVPYVIRTGQAEFYDDVSDSVLELAARDDAHLDTLRALGMRSYICIPLKGRGRTLGTVTLGMGDSGRSFSPDDREVAQELVRRAGLAADNAWLYRESQAAQTRLNLVAEASSELLSSMDFRTRMQHLADMTVPRFSDWCAINLVEPDGSIELTALSHVNPERAPIIREWAERHPVSPEGLTGTPSVIRTGKAEWFQNAAPTPEEIERMDELTSFKLRLQVGSYMIVPLTARGRTIGSISFVQAESGRQFSFQDLLTGQEIARRAALALDNAVLYQQEQQARRDAEENALRIGVLQEVTAQLAGALAPTEVAQVAVEQGIKALQAGAGTVSVRSADGESVEIIQAIGYEPEVVASWSSFPLSLVSPISDAIRTRETILLRGQEALRSTYPQILERQPELIGRAWAAIPMIVEGRVLGALGLTFFDEREFDAQDRAFMNALGQQAAQAMERARLYESELSARQAAERAARRSAWLTNASNVLNASLEFESTFTQLAQLTVPYLADWCQIHLAKGDGTAEQLVMAHQDPEKIKWAKEFGEEIKQYFEPRWDSPTGLPNVLRTGKSELYSDIPDALLQAVAENEVQLEILRGIGYSSVMIVPLNAKGKTLGAITLVNTDSRRHFTEDDLAFSELLAERAAAAIENASLYREKQELATELEQRVEQRTYELSEAYQDLSKEVIERTRAEETMRALLRISSKLNSTLDVETALDVLIEEGLGFANAISGFAGLRTPLGMQMRKFHANGKSIPVDYTWMRGVGVPGWVLEHRAPYVTNDAANDPVLLHALPFNKGITNVVCTPILDAQGEVLGFIEIRNKADGGPFTGADVEFLMALSPIASIAIQNGQAYQRISEAETAVKASYAQLRALAARLQTIREEERTDIARELHDELGQSLTALKMDVVALIGAMPKRNKQLIERARAMTDQIDSTIKTVRRLSSQLRPGMLDDLGLGPSLEWYAQEFQTRTGITIETTIVQDELPLSHAQATALFRIFQETLTNVARHANATRVDARLELEDGNLVLEIRDNGQGFEMDQVRGKRSLGLLGMRERAENVQGTLEILGQPGKGTTVLVKVPVEQVEQ